MTSERTRFIVRSCDSHAHFLSDAHRYPEYARSALEELESFVKQVHARWPKPLSEPIRAGEASDELWELSRKRDRASDSVRIFAAMAIEAFLNFYGTVRVGDAIYNAHFERLNIVAKARQLLLICDSLVVEESDPLIQTLKRISGRRNDLVHPKAKEIERYLAVEERPSIAVPGEARAAVGDMELFFAQFLELVPAAAHLAGMRPAN